MQTVIADFQIMPVERRSSEHLDNFLSGNKSGNLTDGKPHISLHSVASIREIWRSLEKTDAVSLHQSFAWCEAWIAANHNVPLIVSVAISDRVVMILPLEITSGILGETARFIAAPYSNINTGIVDPEFALNASRQLMQTIIADIKAKLANKVDLLYLGNMPEVWQDVPNPFRHTFRVENQNSSYQLPLLDTLEETLSQINAKRRRKKFRKSVKLLDELGGYEHLVAKTPDEKHDLLETFFYQKHIRFAAAGLPDVFAGEEVKDFFRRLTLSPTREGDYPLELHAIRLKNAEGSVAAVAALSRKGNHVICQFSSIDESVAPEASPGELLFYLMIEQTQAAGAKIFDFGIGESRYKSSWCPVETKQNDMLIPLTWRGYMLGTIAALTIKVKSTIKKSEALYNFVQRKRAG